MKAYIFNVASQYLPYLLTADKAGLSEKDVRQLIDFEHNVLIEYGHGSWRFRPDKPDLSLCDVSGFNRACHLIEWVIE